MSAIDVPSERVRPSGWWYALVPIIGVVGIVYAILAGIDEFSDIEDRFTRLGSDGKSSIELREGEHASVWLISESAGSGALDMRGADVRVTGPGGEPIEFEQATARSTFDFGNLGGVRVGDFEAASGGEYKVAATARSMSGPADVAVGNFDVGSAVLHTFRPALIGFLASIGLLVLLLVLRGASKRRARNQPQYDPLQAPASSTPAAPTTSSSQGPISFE